VTTVPLDLDALPEIPGEVVLRTRRGVHAGICAGGWFLRDKGTLQVLDADGTVRAELPPPPTSEPQPLAVDPSTRRSAWARTDRVTLVGADGGTVDIPHPAWRGLSHGAVAFDPTDAGRDRLWSVIPSKRPGGLLPQPPSGVVTLLDAATGSVVASAELHDDHPEGYSMVLAPDRGVVLAGGYGQDGSMTWCLSTDGSSIHLGALGWTGIAAAWDAGSAEILLMPHDDPFLELRGWGARGGTTFSTEDTFGTWEEQEELGGEPDGYDFDGTFLDDQRLVALTWSGRVLVIDRSSGRPIGRLVVDGDDPDVAGIEQVGPGRLLCLGNAVTLVAVSV
jgi:hypothetical protein